MNFAVKAITSACLALAVSFGVSGCSAPANLAGAASGAKASETQSAARQAQADTKDAQAKPFFLSFNRQPAVDASQSAGAYPALHVRSVRVAVPRSLQVSEVNSYLPSGDIVWQGEPFGDRYEQVKSIFEAGLKRGVAPLKGPVEADLYVEVVKFHALTAKARYTTGGIHGIAFLVSVRDARTGKELRPTRLVRADLKAFGGRKALEAEARGETQKVRITEHLANVIRQELTVPGGYKGERGGIISALNHM